MPRIRAMARPSVSASAASIGHLDGEHRALVLGHARTWRTGTRRSSAGAPVGLAEHVGDRRRVVRPADQGQRGVQDDA